MVCRRIAGPHICGDAIDIDPSHDYVLTGSWRKQNALQVSSFITALYHCILMSVSIVPSVCVEAWAGSLLEAPTHPVGGVAQW